MVLLYRAPFCPLHLLPGVSLLFAEGLLMLRRWNDAVQWTSVFTKPTMEIRRGWAADETPCVVKGMWPGGANFDAVSVL
jgi:hypothetical protein